MRCTCTFFKLVSLTNLSQRFSHLSAEREASFGGKFVCLTHCEAKLKHWSLEERKVYCRAMQGDGWLML